MTEYEKMHNGMIYDCFAEELGEVQKHSHRLCERYNKLGVDDGEEKQSLLRELFPNDDFGGYRVMETPIFIDNCREIRIGKNFYSNIHFSFIGGNTAEIGDNVFIGPYCTLATGIHSLIAQERMITVDENGTAHDFEYGRPVKIGNDVWIASNVTICGGVSIGDGSVIGAGSVVTRDIPSGVLAAGNPCRVIREITEKDSMYLKAKRV
ncbi:MAG: sugar O-acetyltransferase [Oscillospiraceae bacterium]|nr:sugar O-acetyltransferase [Oscillospiraceae bacterium]